MRAFILLSVCAAFLATGCAMLRPFPPELIVTYGEAVSTIRGYQIGVTTEAQIMTDWYAMDDMTRRNQIKAMVFHGSYGAVDSQDYTGQDYNSSTVWIGRYTDDGAKELDWGLGITNGVLTSIYRP